MSDSGKSKRNVGLFFVIFGALLLTISSFVVMTDPHSGGMGSLGFGCAFIMCMGFIIMSSGKKDKNKNPDNTDNVNPKEDQEDNNKQ